MATEPGGSKPADEVALVDDDIVVVQPFAEDNLMDGTDLGTGTTGSLDPFGEFDVLDDVFDDPTAS